MKSLLIWLLLLIIASGIGRALLNRFTVFLLAPLERFAFSAALGLGITALGVFGLGMAGQLSFLPITIWLAVLAAGGLGGSVRNISDLLRWFATARTTESPLARGADYGLTYNKMIAPAVGVVLLVLGLFCVCACFQPPTGHEWDVLAYHLADPKVFLAQGRISLLPTEHHSNFPFLMEMLYSIGLVYCGYPLANLLHFATGALTVASVLSFCRRVRPGPTGWIAALLLATTPLFLWECCVAYIDVGMGLYTTLAAFACIGAIDASSAGRAGDSRERAECTRQIGEWCLLAGVMTGFALGIKYLALIPFGILPALLCYRRVGYRHIVRFAVTAALVGCPWYIKNVALTHNPVYPYFFKVFPASRYWSADRAAAYQSEQSGFGYAHSLASPVEAAANLIQTPWRLNTRPDLFTNKGDLHFMALLGGLFAAGIFPLAFIRRLPRQIVDILLMAGVQIVAWFFIAQVARYLVSLLPLAAVLAAYGLRAISIRGPGPARHGANGLRIFPTVVTLVLAGQAALLLWSIAALPTSSKVVLETGMMPTALSLADVLNNATDADSRKRYLERRLDVYAAMDWLNTSTPADAGVVLYDEPRGFYLDHPYLWGNREHSAYIPYDKLRDGEDLTNWLRIRGYRYVLVNLHWSPGNAGGSVVEGRELDLLRTWYAETPAPGEWRFLLADAIRRGLWRVTPAHMHGVVVLEMMAPTSSTTAQRSPGAEP